MEELLDLGLPSRGLLWRVHDGYVEVIRHREHTVFPTLPLTNTVS